MSVDGSWDVTMSTPMGTQTRRVIFVTEGSALFGKLEGPQGAVDFSDGTVEGDKLAWKVEMTSPMPMTLEFAATIEGDSLSGTAQLGTFGTAEFTGVRVAPDDHVVGATTEPDLIAVEMSDGVRLAVHHYRAAVAPAPVIVFMTPYRKEAAWIASMGAGIAGAAGYHLLIADVRGIGGSVAPYEGLLSDREITDFAELIEWAAGQPWSDSQVGTMGPSYCGANQLLVAARQPRGLRCIAPCVSPIDTYRDWTHRGGIPSHASWGAMTYLASQHAETSRRGLEQYYLDLLGDPLDNDGHRRRSPEAALERIEVPALMIGGWHDYFLRATVRAFQAVRGPKRLVIGPWGHAEPAPRVGEELIAWLNWWLKGEGTDPTRTPNVHLYVTGAEEWVSRARWPEPNTVTFHEVNAISNGSHPVRVHPHVSAVMPAMNVKPQLTADPTDSGFGSWGEADVFDTEPLEHDLHVEGPVGLIVRLSIDEPGCDDLDVHARLSVVRSDGGVVQLCEGRLRVGHRAVDQERSLCTPDGTVVVPWHPHDRSEPLQQGEAVEVNIEAQPLSHRFFAGERIRLGLSLARADEGAVPVGATLAQARMLLPLAAE